MKFQKKYQARIAQIDTYLSGIFDDLEGIEDVLREGLRYCVLNGGKRLRSVLCLELCEMLGGKTEDAMPFAAAVECIHAYSLVHDDLPSMDNDDFRRGQPSCHKKFGEGVAILIGDALLNLAFECMADACVSGQQHAVKAMQAVAHAAGGQGMIGGQLQDLAIAGHGSADEVALLAMMERKTSALIRAGALSGAHVAGADETAIAYVDAYAHHLGLAFQLRDDLEDATQDSDISHDNPNYLNTMGREKTLLTMREHVKKAHDALCMLPNHAFLDAMGAYLFGEVSS